VCVSVDMAPYEHTKKSQLTVTNQTIEHTLSSPSDLESQCVIQNTIPECWWNRNYY